MSDKNPCPICGDESEYLRFLDLCAERANEKWRENEVKTMIDVYTSMDFVQVVRCRDCKHYEYWEFRDGRTAHDCARGGDYLFDVEPDGFCAWGIKK